MKANVLDVKKLNTYEQLSLVRMYTDLALCMFGSCFDVIYTVGHNDKKGRQINSKSFSAWTGFLDRIEMPDVHGSISSILPTYISAFNEFHVMR